MEETLRRGREVVMSWDDAYGRSPVATWLIDHHCGAVGCLGHVVYANEAAEILAGATTPGCSGADDSLLRFLDADARIFLEQAAVAALSSTASQPSPSSMSRVVSVDNGSTFALHLGMQQCGRILAQAIPRSGWDAVDRMLAEQQRFRSALMELSELAHTTEDDDDFCQRLIERAIEIVPGAQGGSVQINVPGTTMFRFAAAVGYDLAGLQEHLLDHRVFFRDAWDPNARIVRDFDVEGRSAETTDWLTTVGRLNEIVVNVSGPVLADGFPIAFLSLDNFTDADAMNETSIEMTTVLTRLLGDLLRRRQLEAELRKEREAFRHLALHDPLTGLANRRSLERRMTEMLSTAKQQGRPSSVLFVDIDDFKGVNDRLGHEVGDQVLVEVAKGLTAVVGAGALVGRWGGDEFLVVPHDVASQDQAVALAERILDRFEVEIDVGGGRLHRARLSVGIGWTSDSATGLDELVRNADEALYQAKAAGKGVTRLQVS